MTLLLLLLMAFGPSTARAVEETTSDVVLIDAGDQPEQQILSEDGNEVGGYDGLGEDAPPEEDVASDDAEAESPGDVDAQLEVMATEATSGTCGDNLYWSYADGTLTITGSGNMTSCPWSDFASEITSVSLPKGLTSICSNAFSGCTSLTSLDIPATVTSLGCRFMSGTAIAELVVPASVTSASRYLNGGSWYGPFAGATSLRRVSFADGMSAIPDYMLCASSVKSVFIPSSVISIGRYAFLSCTSLTSVTIPKGVASIGDGAFKGCTSLTMLNIPSTVTSLGCGFISGTAISELVVPASVTSVGLNVTNYGERLFPFDGVTSLRRVSFADGMTAIPDYMLYGVSSVESVHIPSSVTSIGYSAFSGCTSLTSADIPSRVTSIGYAAFNGCSGLKDVYYYGNVSQEKWDAIKINGGNAPLLGAKLRFVKAPVVGTDYGVLQYAQTKADEIKRLANKYVSDVNAYISAVQSSAERNANKIEASNSNKAHGEVLKEAEANASLETFTPDPSLSAAWKKAAYEGLALYYDDCAKIGESFLLGSIDMSADTISVSTTMVKTIRIFMSKWDSRKYDVGGKTVEIDIAGSAGAAHVGAVYVNDSFAGTICSSPEDTAVAMTAYLNELKKWEKDAICTALREVVKEFTKATGISEWTKGKLTKLLQKKLAVFDRIGLGDVYAYCTQMRKGYDAVHTLIRAATTDDAIEALQTPDAIANSLDSLMMEPDNVSDALVNAALKKVDSAKSALVNALREYAIDKIENTNQMGLRDVVDSVLGGISKTYKKYFVKCPVDVYVYDSATGTELGHIADGEADYVDGIAMALDGDVKTIGIPDGIDAQVKVVGTGTGTMTYVVEQVEDGKVTGRANWYDLPLEEGVEYAQVASGDPLDSNNVPALVTNGESVEMSAYFSADDEDAHVHVEVQAGEGGVALGDEYYVLGSPVTVMALPDDGYVFDGWYHDDALIATTSTYRFSAREDVSLQARFSYEAVEDEAFTVVMDTAYQDQCALIVRSRADGLDDLIAVLDDFGDDAPNLSLRTFASTGSAATVGELPCEEEDGFALIAQGIDLSGALRTDVLLPDGSILGSIYPEGGLETFANGIPVSMLSVSVGKQTYSGKKLEPKPTVKLGNTTLTVGRDYTLTYENNVAAGTGTVRIKGIGDYCGERKVTFEIAAAANPMTAEANEASVSATYNADLVTTLAKNVTTSKAQGAVTYANASTDAIAKKLTVNKTSGQVTVPKATEAGTYIVKVKVTAAGNANYKSKSIIVTYNVVVNKAANPMKVKAVTRKVKLAKLKKKAVTVAAPLKFSKKAQGKVTYAKVAKGSSKRLTVNKSTGKVKVKKGTKKGTYTIKIKVTASGNANYEAKSQTVKCKVKVK